MRTSNATVIGVALAAMLAVSAGAQPQESGPDQIAAGELSNWADKSTWSTPDPDAGTTEVGMGLVLQGSAGAVRLAFFVDQPTRRRGSVPTSVGFRVAATLQMNPNMLRRPTLVFSGAMPSADDPEVLEAFEVDLSSAMTVNDPSPRATINSGVGRMATDVLRKLAEAVELEGEVLGAAVEFREDQIEAIKEFAERVLPDRP